MARQRRRLGWAHVGAARFRRAARGRAGWLADDLAHGRPDELPDLDRPASNANGDTARVERRRPAAPVLTAVPDPDDGPDDRPNRPEDADHDPADGPADGPGSGSSPVPVRSARRSLLPDRPPARPP